MYHKIGEILILFQFSAPLSQRRNENLKYSLSHTHWEMWFFKATFFDFYSELYEIKETAIDWLIIQADETYQLLTKYLASS